MKTDLYQNELRVLRDGARDFARKYPVLAPHLSGSSTDPDVERILQGTAFLSAGIQERLDNDFPDFAQSILRIIAPDYLKEIPATTIVEFSPRNILNNPVTIESGSKVDSKKISGRSCRFHICRDVVVYPLTISNCNVLHESNGSSIEVAMYNTSLANAELSLSDLPLHLSGDYVVASQLYYLLTKHVKKVVLVAGNDEYNLPSDCLTSEGWNDTSLLENNSSDLNGYRRVQEYFINKFKFLFLNIGGLDNIGRLPKVFKIKFVLDQHAHNLNIDKSNVRLFCAPAVNLFDTDAEPIALDHKSYDMPINPVRNLDKSLTINSIVSLHGQSRRSSEKMEYQSFSLAAKETGNNPVYELIQHYAGVNDQDNILRVSYPNDMDMPPREVLTAKLKCSNGSLAGQLKVGDVSVNTPDIPDLVSLQNVSTISEYIAPVTGGRTLWKLITHLTVNYLPVANLDNLKTMLSLYNPTEQSDTREHAANKKRIDSLQSLTEVPVERLQKGYLIRGRNLQIEVDGSSFASVGDLYLFGELLFTIFSQFNDINSFLMLSLTNINNGEIMQWQT
ncbi:type VI secretion system baseplate subunit TssF [Bacterioplanoides sp.]|uniref:type VI secretion system baseplate subunit TssF n=1 Tax=Bacterioplanoides sp. TaxID=2066072 RepID=UPI003AFFE897